MFNFFKKPVKNKYDDLTQEEALKLIKPIMPDYSEAEQLLAKARAVYHQDLEDIIFSLSQYVKKSLEGKELDESTIRFAQNALEEMNAAFDEFDKNPDIEWWDAYGNKDLLNSLHKYATTEGHAGDCTAFPCSCMRCWAEEYYKAKSTANWSKGDGYKIYEKAYKK